MFFKPSWQELIVMVLHFFGAKEAGWYCHWNGVKNFKGPFDSNFRAFSALPDYTVMSIAGSEIAHGVEWRWRKPSVPYKW